MRQNEEYDDTVNYNEGKISQADYQCQQCHESSHYTHQCENAWSQVMDLCDSLDKSHLKGKSKIINIMLIIHSKKIIFSNGVP